MSEFQHSYRDLPEALHAQAPLRGFSAPELLAWNQPLATQLGLEWDAQDPAQLARWLSGTESLPGTAPLAQAYAGHQFGQFVPQLGDGRAMLLGELVDAQGRRWDLQLKGAGRTPWSRGGDGLSSLGPVLREFLLSEAMHRLGVPTTRALAAVVTGEEVFRRQAEPGGVLTRVAASHLRIGTFQYLAARGDQASLKALADYAIARHDPDAAAAQRPYLALFQGVVERQARLVAHWLSLGFIHGVMNTDNTSISGETLDYGPCAFMDEYRALKVFSSIDQNGRYAYANQAPIVHWNLARLAECLLVLDPELDGFQNALDRTPELIQEHRLALMRPKLGLATAQADDATLVDTLLQALEAGEADFTLSFRELSGHLHAPDKAWGEFGPRWQQRLQAEGRNLAQVRACMDSVNPLYIPRNHQVERAIQAAFAGDYTVFDELRTVLESPFDVQPGREDYALAPARAERVTQTFCGT